MSEPGESVGGSTGKMLVIGATCVLIIGGCILCAGGLAAPFILKQRAAEMQRVEAQRQFEKAQEATRKKAAQEAAECRSADNAGDDSSESGNPQ